MAKLQTFYGFLLISLIQTALSLKCGLSPVSHLRIVGGENALPHQYPWMVYLQVEHEPIDPAQHMKFSYCGATLIDSQWIASAAHCFAEHNANYTINLHGKKTLVVLGAHNLTDKSENHIILHPENMYVHEQYNPLHVPSNYDIALIKLQHPLNLEMAHNRIAPICLPTQDEQISKTECQAVGWGRTVGTGKGSKILKFVNLNLYNREECAKHNRHIDDTKVCAGYLNHRPCKGDSGGPLQCKNAQGQWVLQGITSYGPKLCITDTPSVFTRVEHFMPWINKIRSAHV